MLDYVSTALTTLIGYIGEVVSAIVTSNGAFGALLPLVMLSVAIGIVGYGIRTIKSLCWGI